MSLVDGSIAAGFMCDHCGKKLPEPWCTRFRVATVCSEYLKQLGRNVQVGGYTQRDPGEFCKACCDLRHHQREAYGAPQITQGSRVLRQLG